MRGMFCVFATATLLLGACGGGNNDDAGDRGEEAGEDAGLYPDTTPTEGNMMAPSPDQASPSAGAGTAPAAGTAAPGATGAAQPGAAATPM
jgi:hypothetical protein